ncbi:LPP20 lipoprotein [Hydrogenivirga caldilitoris]|uniref:LPP20 lipoprotein n=1 Tax=Hydrogenivirga caldilitoris TaxID=246264 RepID=A0A497XQ83_9AQUI|nr:LPP20 family lipoprotein [Hydrogenivirga caldilitoris]RLJ70414.1 LPP20 lipoprotein [Hydrogenivirga caldilitoris]
MRHLLVPLLLPLLLFVSCGPKTEKVKTEPRKEEQLQRAERAFEELEREAPKPAKELTLEEGRTPQLREEPQRLEKAPIEIAKREEPRTKYPLKDGLPVWVHNPNYGGVLGGVGIAKKIPGKGYAEQKRLAKQIALADLAKQIEIIVKSELTKVEINVDTQTLQYYKKTFNSLSEQEVREVLIKNATIEDEWIDPKTGDLYVWVVLKR